MYQISNTTYAGVAKIFFNKEKFPIENLSFVVVFSQLTVIVNLFMQVKIGGRLIKMQSR